MADLNSQILPLPVDVVAQIRSSSIITSLSSVILQLLRNSLDAGASRAKILVDYQRGSCTVEDDGLGISPEEFLEDGGLGKMHCQLKLLPVAETRSHMNRHIQVQVFG